MTLPKWLITDLDETLLLEDRSIGERTLNAIRRIRSLGVKFGIATTRSKRFAQRYLDELSPDIAVLGGGSVGYLDGSLVFEQTIEKHEVLSLFESITECNNVRKVVIDTPKQRLEATDVKHLELTEDPYSGFFWLHPPYEVKEYIHRHPNVRFTELWEVGMYRLSSPLASKHGGLKRMLVDVEPREVICFGDDLMDVGMVDYYYGVAVGNALDPVKEVADEIIGPNTQEAVAQYIEQLIQRKHS
ncbi:MAG: HAD family hydrolase [Sphaerochaetaceae bacterium]|jgi:hydroxymethylpyrimidine pyrophosphatase-like HAD family hydrolase